jgi:hypothetical protein
VPFGSISGVMAWTTPVLIFTEHVGDPYLKGALRLANSHLDALATIRRDVVRL